MTAILKFPYIRSKPLMALYRTIPCQNCTTDDGTVCGAHSNQSKHGKCLSIKASDEFAASLCAICHAWLDFGSASREAKIAMWTKAHEKTKALLTKLHGDAYLNLIGAVVEEPAQTEWE